MRVCDDSETRPTPSSPEKPKLHEPDAAATESIARIRRLRRLTVRYPRLERLCPPQSESFWVIGGRPGDFKTGLLWNLALNAARAKQRVLFVSLEMTPDEMALLALGVLSGIERRRLEDALSERIPFTDGEREAWDGAVLTLQGLQFTLRLHGASEHGRDIGDVLESAARARFDAVMIDHLGMIGRDSQGHELELLSQAIHRLRGLSRGEGVEGYRPWVVATSQFNRDIDKSDDGEPRIPRLSDFRGSARIEHDSDVVIGLQKRKRLGDEGAECVLDGFVLKNRSGPAPVVLVWNANGATGLVTERNQGDSPPPPAHWATEREAGEEG